MSGGARRRGWGLALACALASPLAAACRPFPDSLYPEPQDMAPALDACAQAPARRGCVTLHLRGGVGPIDEVQLDATFELGQKDVTRRVVVVRGEGPAPPPIAVGLILPEDAGESVDLTVLARRQGSPVALARGDVYDLYPGAHKHTALELTAAERTRCFNGRKDGDERGVDCGAYSGCPACTAGSQCLLDKDCVDGSCEGSRCR